MGSIDKRSLLKPQRCLWAASIRGLFISRSLSLLNSDSVTSSFCPFLCLKARRSVQLNRHANCEHNVLILFAMTRSQWKISSLLWRQTPGPGSETASAVLEKPLEYFCNNVSKAGESEAAMHSLSNYCCGPGTALPKSRSNNVRGRSRISGRKKRIIGTDLFFIWGERL